MQLKSALTRLGRSNAPSAVVHIDFPDFPDFTIVWEWSLNRRSEGPVAVAVHENGVSLRAIVPNPSEPDDCVASGANSRKP
jgi:hypothetical protein